MINRPLKNATYGEKLFYNRLKYFLSQRKEIICYSQPTLTTDLRPDYLLFSPNFGIIIVEIKDYKSEYLKNTPTGGEWEYLRNEKSESVRNPFDQIYNYRDTMTNIIGFCGFTKEIENQIHPIQLICFSLISEQDPIAIEIRKKCPDKFFVCFKEILNRNESFENFLKDIIPMNVHLSKDQFDTLRGNVIPESRLPILTQTNLDKYFSIEERVKLLEREQEEAARKLGEGHHLIFGVAGSGKTTILVARVKFLAKKYPDWKILVLCYNKLLKDLLRLLINPGQYYAKITINTFHKFAKDYISIASDQIKQIYQNALLKAQDENKLTEFFQSFVPSLLLQVFRDPNCKKNIYDAILIDEAQDFEEDWFRAIINVLNKESNSLLITCDGLQGIYDRKKFYWSNVGIQARGRSLKLVKSYRIPIEIGYLAQNTLPTTLKELLDKTDEYNSIKEYRGEHGTVELLEFETKEEECEALSNKIALLLKQPQQILILFKYNIKNKNYNHLLFTYLRNLQIDWRNLDDNEINKSGLIVGTIYSAKGLEYDTIIIPEINSYISDKERQLLYVGITRSRKKIILSANKTSKLVEVLRENQINKKVIETHNQIIEID